MAIGSANPEHLIVQIFTEIKVVLTTYNSLPAASGDFCRLLKIFANSLDPDLDSNRLTL